jgi:hypothetical protein
MTANELQKKKQEIRARAEGLDKREAEFSRQADDKENDTTVPTPTPSPSTYATSIKIHAPITLELNASN